MIAAQKKTKTARSKFSFSGHNTKYGFTSSIDFDEFDKVRESYTQNIILRKSEPFKVSRA